MVSPKLFAFAALLAVAFACQSDTECQGTYASKCCVAEKRCMSPNYLKAHPECTKAAPKELAKAPNTVTSTPKKAKKAKKAPSKPTQTTTSVPENAATIELAKTGTFPKLTHPLSGSDSGIPDVSDSFLDTKRAAASCTLDVVACYFHSDSEFSAKIASSVADIKKEYATVKSSKINDDPKKLHMRQIQFHNALKISKSLILSLNARKTDLAGQMKYLFQYWQQLMDGTAKESGDIKGKNKKRGVTGLVWALKEMNAKARASVSTSSMPKAGSSNEWRSDDVGVSDIAKNKGGESKQCRINFLPTSDVPSQIEKVMGLVYDELHKKPSARTMSALEFAARVHGALISIHPFIDGNGRSVTFFSLAVLRMLGDDFPFPDLTFQLVGFGRLGSVQQNDGFAAPFAEGNAGKPNAYPDPVICYIKAAKDTITAMKASGYQTTDVAFMFPTSFVEQESRVRRRMQHVLQPAA